MAIPLNKYAVRCEELAISSGWITTNSSATPLMYDISRDWRMLLKATSFRCGAWTEREEAAADVIVSTLAYLNRLGCSNIEKLLTDSIERHARQDE